MKLLCCFLLGVLLTCFSVGAIGHGVPTDGSPAGAGGKAAKKPSRAQDLTMSLLDAKGKYEGAPEAGKRQQLADLVDLARTRMEAMTRTLKAIQRA
jgi:hypothetical protein